MDRFAAVALGMEVLGADGAPVGAVKDIVDAFILIDRPWRRDIYVPFEAIHAFVDSRIVLAVSAADIDGLGWPHPPLL